MSHPRATAQQAIEVLKVYKLRKENAVILEEIKRLRGEVIGRQHDLSNALRQVADLQTQISDVVHNAREHDTKLETLEVARNSANDSIRGLRQEYEQARHDLTHKIEGQQAAIEKNHAATEKLRGENGHFRKQIEDSDNRIANIVDDMSQDLNAKAEQQDVIEFNARLNQLIQDLDLRLKAHESVSRVTDTAEQRIDLTLDPTLPSDVQYDDSMWKPIGAPNKAETVVQPEDNSRAEDAVDIRVEAQSTEAAALPIAVSLQGNMISNMPHDTDQDEGPAIIAGAETSQQRTVRNQSAEQQTSSEVPVERRSGLVLPALRQDQIPQPHTSSEATRQLLYAILKLRQEEDESLTQYFARFRALMAAVALDEEVSTICLRRLLNGLREREQRDFFHEWLITSEYSLQHAQECVVMLTRCLLNRSLDLENRSKRPDGIEVESGKTRQQKTDADERANQNEEEYYVDLRENRESKDELSDQATRRRIPHAYSGRNQHTSPIKGESCPNVTTPAAAAAQKGTQAEGTTKAATRKARKCVHQKKTPSDARQSKNCQKGRKGSEQVQVGKIIKTMHARKTVRSAVTPEMTTRTPGMLADLEGEMTPRPARRVAKDPITPQRPANEEKGIFDPPESDQDGMPSTPPAIAKRLARTPVFRSPRQGVGKISRIPTLVPPVGARPVIPETSDPIHLPPARPQEGCEKEAMEVKQPSKRRKARCNTLPEIPILTLTPSDFDA